MTPRRQHDGSQNRRQEFGGSKRRRLMLLEGACSAEASCHYTANISRSITGTSTSDFSLPPMDNNSHSDNDNEPCLVYSPVTEETQKFSTAKSHLISDSNSEIMSYTYKHQGSSLFDFERGSQVNPELELANLPLLSEVVDVENSNQYIIQPSLFNHTTMDGHSDSTIGSSLTTVSPQNIMNNSINKTVQSSAFDESLNQKDGLYLQEQYVLQHQDHHIQTEEVAGDYGNDSNTNQDVLFQNITNPLITWPVRLREDHQKSMGINSPEPTAAPTTSSANRTMLPSQKVPNLTGSSTVSAASNKSSQRLFVSHKTPEVIINTAAEEHELSTRNRNAMVSHNIILAIDFYHGKLAAVALNTSESRLCIVEDFNLWLTEESIAINKDHITDVIQNIVSQIQPSIIITTADLYDYLHSILLGSTKCKQNASTQQYLMEVPSHVDSNCKNVFDFDIQVRPLKEFFSTKEAHEFISLLLFKISERHNKNNTILKSTLQNLQSSPELNVALKAFSGLVNHLEASRDLTIDNDGFDISIIQYVETINLQNHMFIDQDSLYALQVLPNTNTRYGELVKNAKTSVYDLLNCTGSSIGSKLLKTWITMPLYNIDQIRQRHNTVEFLADSKNVDCVADLRKLMHGLPNIFQLLSLTSSNKLGLVDWENLRKYVQKGIFIINNISSLIGKICNTDSQSIISNIYEQCPITEFQKILGDLVTIIDFESSKLEGKLVINQQISSILDEKKKLYNDLDEILNQAATDAAGQFPFQLQKLVNAAYIPQLGYLLLVNTADEYGNSLDLPFDELTNNMQWEEVFRTTTTIFFKNNKVAEMDDAYGDIYNIICDLEIEILHNLQQEIVTAHQPTLLISGKLFAELDCYLGLAHVAVNENYCRPEMTIGIDLQVEESRHPLYETIVESAYIPNKIHLQTNTSELENWQLDSERILMLTGANFSGKSVYVTQVALIVIMAQIGS